MTSPAIRYRAVPFNQVTLSGGFWGPRQAVNQAATLPAEYEQCRATGRLDAFKLDWKPGQKPIPHIFWDSDVAKLVEAASYTLATHPESDIATQFEDLIALIVSAQQPDGYLNTHFTVVEPEKRWTNERDNHELYCAGHLFEAAVAHFHATGRRNFLDAACHFADYIATVFGPGPGQKRGYPGHEELELALVRLYRATGEHKYLALSQFFVDERGQQPYFYDEEARARGEDPGRFIFKTYAYMQAHRPVREQDQVVGHAVRAMYLYSAMTDLAGETGDEGLLQAVDRLWDHLTGRSLYVTGGIGPSPLNEGFSTDYDLPNDTAYAETCAAVGLAFWSHRLLQLRCDRRYGDVLERVVYNGALSGVSLDGTRFFYENPLGSKGAHHRQPWFDCACCPPNIARLIASLGSYVYSTSVSPLPEGEGAGGEGELPTHAHTHTRTHSFLPSLAVHLYAHGRATLDLAGQPVTIRQATDYPWDGRVDLSIEPAQPLAFTLCLRVPGWCRSARLAINGQPEDLSSSMELGYVRLERMWIPGDRVSLDFDMPVERTYAHPDIRQDAGLVALQRGPVVYCFEQADHQAGQAAPVHRLRLPRDAALTARFERDLLGGVVVITGEGQAAQAAGGLYATEPPALHPVPLTAIPYFAWDNRTPGEMQVWLLEV